MNATYRLREIEHAEKEYASARKIWTSPTATAAEKKQAAEDMEFYGNRTSLLSHCPD